MELIKINQIQRNIYFFLKDGIIVKNNKIIAKIN